MNFEKRSLASSGNPFDTSVDASPTTFSWVDFAPTPTPNSIAQRALHEYVVLQYGGVNLERLPTRAARATKSLAKKNDSLSSSLWYCTVLNYSRKVTFLGEVSNGDAGSPPRDTRVVHDNDGRPNRLE
jgi:hypothetical protein